MQRLLMQFRLKVRFKFGLAWILLRIFIQFVTDKRVGKRVNWILFRVTHTHIIGSRFPLRRSDGFYVERYDTDLASFIYKYSLRSPLMYMIAAVSWRARIKSPNSWFFREWGHRLFIYSHNIYRARSWRSKQLDYLEFKWTKWNLQ